MTTEADCECTVLISHTPLRLPLPSLHSTSCCCAASTQLATCFTAGMQRGVAHELWTDYDSNWGLVSSFPCLVFASSLFPPLLFALSFSPHLTELVSIAIFQMPPNMLAVVVVVVGFAVTSLCWQGEVGKSGVGGSTRGHLPDSSANRERTFA